MDQKKCADSIPEHVLTSLEDMEADVLDLRELMLMLAATAQDLPDRVPASGQEQVH